MGVKAFRPSDLRALLETHGVRPRKALGQNFLVDGNTRNIILEAASPASGETVLEIGPGAGVLTEGLLDGGNPVVAVEKDAALSALLRRRFSGRPTFRLVEADALETDLNRLFNTGIRTVVSNLPYSCGTRILVSMLFAEPAPDRMVVTLQAEVAERVVAPPGSSAYGLLALWAGWRYETEVIRKIPPTCFYPAPEVQSSLIRLIRRRSPRVELQDPLHFKALTRWAFTQRRKQLQTLFRRLPALLGRLDEPAPDWLAAAGMEVRARPGDLGVEAWGVLSNRLKPGPAFSDRPSPTPSRPVRKP